MNSNWLKTRQTKFASYATIYILVVLAVLTFVNILAKRYDKSYDSTKNKQFSLSDQTIKIVSGLKQDVTVYYFGAEDSFRSGRDLLDRYSVLSPKLHVQYIAPDKNPQKAKTIGYRSDSPVMVDSGIRKEGAKSLTEEEVTGALIRSLKTAQRNVCFTSGFGEHSIEDSDRTGFSFLKQLLDRDNYQSRMVTLKPAAPDNAKMAIGQAAPAGAVEVPADCTVLVVGGPQEAYPPPVADAIKNYVEKGGRAMIMLDNVVRIGKQDAAAPNTDLETDLSNWGVTVGKDLVLDGSGIGQLFGFGPEIPVVMQYERHQITQPFGRVMTAFELVRSLDIKSGGNASVDKLVQTTEDSLAITEIGPGGTIDQKKARKGPFTLAAAGTLSGGGKGRFVVVGTSEWATNQFAGTRQLGNRDLFVNSINWLSSDEDLISIRPKAPEDQPFNITTQKLNTLFWLSIVIFPLGVVGFGLATWWKRR